MGQLDFKHNLIWSHGTRGCSLMKFISSLLPSDNSMTRRHPLMPSGLLPPWLVLLVPRHGKGLDRAEGAWSPVPSGWERRWPSNSTSSARLPKAGDTQPVGLRKCIFKAALALPSTTGCAHPSAVLPPASKALGCTRLPAGLETSHAGRQGWGLGKALRGARCGTVTDGANWDDIPGVFSPTRTSGKLL